jgi:NADH-quinone oxidoreductase subunit H
MDWNQHWAVQLGRVVLMWLLPLMLLPLMIWFERKASAFMQDRTGPNRAAIGGVRLGGIIHTIADVLKLLGKEDVVPAQVNKFYYAAAPIIAILVSQLLFVVVPFADSIVLGGHTIDLQALRLDVGILYPLAVGSVFVYSIVLAGWASNNKYGVLGGLRAAAQVVSYEVAMGLSIVGALMVYGTTDLGSMVRQQGDLLFGFVPKWGVVVQPLGALLFLVAAFAETNRTPFDLPERDSELVAGYHTEYSAVRFASFFMAEYVHIIVAAGLWVTLFFGGWQVPWLPTETLRDHAGIVLHVMLGGMVAAGFGAAALAARWVPSLLRQYADRRRYEGHVLATLFGGLGVLGVAGLVLVQGRVLPDWAPDVIAAVVQFTALTAKVLFFAFAFIWVRWTLPSFRYDQLMRLGWKNMMPLALANVGVTGILMLAVASLGGR